jgi:hypothetical protein
VRDRTFGELVGRVCRKAGAGRRWILKIDYFALVDAATLEPLDEPQKNGCDSGGDQADVPSSTIYVSSDIVPKQGHRRATI